MSLPLDTAMKYRVTTYRRTDEYGKHGWDASVALFASRKEANAASGPTRPTGR